MYNSYSQTDPILRSAVIMIAVVLTFSALKLGQDFFAPLVLGLVTGVILGPLTDVLRRLGLPVALAASLILVMGVVFLTGLAVLAEPLIWRIVEELPKLKWEIRSIIGEFRTVINGLAEVNQEVEEVLGTSSGDTEDGDTSGTNAMPSVADALFLAPVVVAHVLIFAGTLFFFLLTRKNIYDWLSRKLGGDQMSNVEGSITRAEHMVSRYVLAISVINVGLGITLALMLWAIGLPAPFVWGAAAALLNFVLYLGPMVITIGLCLAGLVAFSGPLVILPPAIFLTLNIIESQLVTPSLIGKHVAINPLLVFVSLLFWLWLWGPVGGIIAIPLLVIAVAMSDLFHDQSQPGNS